MPEEGRPSRLLDNVWADLRRQLAVSRWQRGDVLKAVRAAAPYQPDQAFAFAQAASQLELDTWEHNEVAEIMRVVAYDARYTAHAFDELWTRAITDKRPSNAHPSHAARLLTELAGYERYKSIEFSAWILELAADRIRNSPNYVSALRQIRDALMDPAISRSSAADLFWRTAELNTETLSVLDEWLHKDTAHIDVLETLIRQCHKAIALERPIFALHACQLAGALSPVLAESVENAFVENAMPNNWSSAPGQVPPAFAKIVERAQGSYEMYRALPSSDLFRRIEAEAVRRGRSNVDDYQ